MARPTKLPRWADGGSADKVEPVTGKKDDGFYAAEHPPAQFLNWLLYYIYLWIQYFSTGGFDVTERTIWSGGTTNNVIIPIDIPVGAQLNGDVTVHVDRGMSSGTVTAYLQRGNLSTGGNTNEDSATTASGTGVTSVTLTPTTTTLGSTEAYFIDVDLSSAGTTPMAIGINYSVELIP